MRPRGSAKPRLTDVQPLAGDTALSEACTDTGIQSSHEEICNQGSEHVEGRGDQHGAAHQRIVARVDRVVDELADAWPSEDDLCEHGPRKHMADTNAQERYCR